MSGGTVSSVTDAADILSQMEDNNRDSLAVRISRPLRTYGRARKVDESSSSNASSSLSSLSPPMKRRRDSLVSVMGNVMVLRDRVSLREHLQRLLCLLTWSDRHGGRWMGIRQFIDCYFSLLFQPYLGDAFKLNIIHVANKRKICALFSAGSKGSYTILVMLNYPLWDRILRVSTALPNRYFRRSVRSRVNDGKSLGGDNVRKLGECDFDVVVDSNESIVRRTDENQDSVRWYQDGAPNPMIDQYTSTSLFKMSLAALCLMDRLEYSMQIDRESVTFSHVITLARFFSNSQEAKRLFRTNTTFQ